MVCVTSARWTTIGAQDLDALDHNRHLAEAVELVEHDHDWPGLVGAWILFLHGREKIRGEQPDLRREGFDHQRLDNEVDAQGGLTDCPEIKVGDRSRLVDRRVLPLIKPRGHQERDIRDQRIIVRRGKAWGMERRGIQTTAGDLWRDAYGQLERVREVVSGLRERFAEAYARVREVAELSLNGLAEALRGADFSTLEAAPEQARERDREAERSIEHERDISCERDDVFNL